MCAERAWHPFTWLSLWLVIAAAALMVPPWWPLAGVLALVLLWLVSGPERGRQLRLLAWLALPLAGGLWLVHSQWLGALLFDTQWHWPWAATELWLRLVLIMSGGQAVLVRVRHDELVRALLASRLPASLAYLLASPLMLMAQIRAQLPRIHEAQLARGVPLDGHFFQRVRSLPYLLLPLLSGLLDEVAQRGQLLERRGFRGGIRRVTLDAPADPAPQRWLRQLNLASALLILVVGAWYW